MYVWTSMMVKINIMIVQLISLGVTFLKAQSSKLEGLFCHVSVKRGFRALSFELWNSIRKCHPKWDWLYFDDWQWIQKCKPIPLGVTFSNALYFVNSKIYCVLKCLCVVKSWRKRWMLDDVCKSVVFSVDIIWVIVRARLLPHALCPSFQVDWQ